MQDKRCRWVDARLVPLGRQILMLTEIDIMNLSPSQLRYEEARFFLSAFIRHCGPPVDSYFGMVACFDAFLFCFVSIEELVTPTQKNTLNAQPVFKFLKAARNVTTHRSVLASPVQKGGYERPFYRVIREETGTRSASARLCVSIEGFRNLFATVGADRIQEQPTLDAAEDYLKDLAARGIEELSIQGVSQEGLEVVARLLGF